MPHAPLRALALSIGLGALLSGCAGRAPTAAAPSPAGASPIVRVYDVKAARYVDLSSMAAALARADVVFFGEQHDDHATHAAELAVLAAVGERRAHMVLSLEMFERDVQALLDRYLAGTVGESAFLAASRPWPQYTTDYRPLVELARVRGWPVVAANVPRRLASAVSRQGLRLLDTLNATDRGWMARDNRCPKDAYYTRFAETMSGHGPGGGPPTATDTAAMRAMIDRFYEAQCVKDEAMGEAIAEALSRAPAGTTVLHVDGAFHSDFGLGTAERLRWRRPDAKTVVLSAIPLADPMAADPAAHAGKADYLLFTKVVPKSPPAK